MENKTNDFIKKIILEDQNRNFIISIIATLIGYVGITFWLNAIRADATRWFVWVLIIIQLLLYFNIFFTGYKRSKECGLKYFGFILFLVLAILGRVENWELIIIPALIIIMIIISLRYLKTEKQKIIKF